MPVWRKLTMWLVRPRLDSAQRWRRYCLCKPSGT